MSAVIEERKLITDPTAGMELVTGDEVALEATRHIFIGVNLLDPARQRDINLPDGGEEIGSRCLRRTGGLLPKCAITPLELWAEWWPLYLFPEGTEHLALKLKDVAMSPQERELINTNPLAKLGAPLYGYPYYPAHAIVDALGIATGEKRGVVEIEVLRGTDYGKYDRELQNLFFPTDFKLPVEVRRTREHIETVAGSVVDSDVHSAATDMIRSVDEGSAYMLEQVSKANSQLDERVTHQYVHRLTPKIRSFMAQLEIKPRAEGAAENVQETVNKALASTLSPEILSQLGKQQEVLANLGPAIGKAVGEAVAAALAANKSTKPPKGE